MKFPHRTDDIDSVGRTPDGVSSGLGRRPDGPANQAGLNYGPAPLGIARSFHSNIGYAGLKQRSSAQTATGVDNPLVIPHAVASAASASARSIGGALAPQQNFGSGTLRVPPIYAPIRGGKSL